MKQLKTLLLAVTLTFSSVLMASTNTEKPSTTESSKITVKIERFLKNPSFDVDYEMTAKVTLTLNKNNELVVLSVDSEDDKMESFIKSRLNYRKVSGSYETLNKEFVVPVRITSGE
ncbi:hypothetical protein MWU58_06660 [Flavobacteriaceae bacterium S0825]|uniref:hypothetical protein n=1 Tax=Gaetbulibacter sp. S0825 TaxID=2720084 RepID=UPI00142FD84E|nr:hypothetical protein [Gaetbulibacter sp. S0825]MCK0108966.1 hypothetical protein [Flavobacteriaceae bacterium S0825]NIX64601.1 hypothetical protein [Gaetbulibacter sp. S0825]